MDQCTHSTIHTNSNELHASSKHDVHQRLRQSGLRLKSNGVHSSIALKTAGFRYTGNGDTARCDKCGLEVSDWTEDMKPFFVHAERSIECPFVRSKFPKSFFESDEEENSEQRKYTCKFIELKSLKQIRRRTFSHWSREAKPSAEQMILAGFFACNAGDRVICLYCNLICQQWIPDIDDPSEVHKTLSPKCPYVLSMLIQPELSSTLIINDNSINNQTNDLNNTTQLRFDQIVHTTPCNPNYSNITNRIESFTTWTSESSPPVDELVRAGFFYTGANNVVTCFYCSGSLQNWGATDNPVIEHARWFPSCPYAKQLCGDDLHHRIQEAKRIQQERARANQSNETNQNNNLPVLNNPQLPTNDTNMIARFVAARLDLSSSQSLLNQNFQLAVIKRSWEDQLQLKQDDFVSDSDLLISCVILQKQIDHIQGNKDNIVVPSVKMKLIRERKQSSLSPLTALLNGSKTEAMETESASTTSTIESTTTNVTKENSKVAETISTTNPSISNPCVVCYQEEKRLACIPCGHFTACVSCSNTLRICPVCRKEIEAFVKIYM